MDKCLVLFVEGDTEVEFYKHVIANARQKRESRKFDINIECKNVKGVGGFKSIALRKFVKEIRPRYGGKCEFSIALCRDTDVFELSAKPPINWEEVEREKRLARATLDLQRKFGKNAIVMASDLQEGATLIERNKLIGGHNADE